MKVRQGIFTDECSYREICNQQKTYESCTVVLFYYSFVARRLHKITVNIGNAFSDLIKTNFLPFKSLCKFVLLILHQKYTEFLFCQ